MAIRCFSSAVVAIVALALLAGCKSFETKLAKAESAFDKGDYETAQFAYFDLLQRSTGPAHEKAVASLSGRLKPLVGSPSFASKDYTGWAATLENSPDLKAEMDAAFAGGLKFCVEGLIKEGKIQEAAIDLGYLPEGQSDGGLALKVKEAKLASEEATYKAGFDLYKNHKYEEAIAEWKNLDPASTWNEKAKTIIAKIPAEKKSFYLSQARKKPLDGFKLEDARPVARVVFNRIKGQGFDNLEAGDNREFLEIQARIGGDIDLVAWYMDGDSFVSVGRLEREFVSINADDPEAVKRSFKRTISKDQPVDVVYFINVDFDFHRKHDIYVSDNTMPYRIEDLKDLSIVTTF